MSGAQHGAAWRLLYAGYMGVEGPRGCVVSCWVCAVRHLAVESLDVCDGARRSGRWQDAGGRRGGESRSIGRPKASEGVEYVPGLFDDGHCPNC